MREQQQQRKQQQRKTLILLNILGVTNTTTTVSLAKNGSIFSLGGFSTAYLHSVPHSWTKWRVFSLSLASFQRVYVPALQA